jgi:hypothetical protein
MRLEAWDTTRFLDAHAHVTIVGPARRLDRNRVIEAP